MARDWTKAFRRAAFRGVSFETDIEEAAGARRLSVSPIAYADTSVIEDMGREPRRLSLTAYVAGDAADARAVALSTALDAPGPAVLMLPMLGLLRARVQEWRLSREKDRAGYVAFEIAFIEEGLGGVPFGPVAGAGPIAELMKSGSAILGAALSAGLRAAPRASIGREAESAQAAGDRLAGVAAASGAADAAVAQATAGVVSAALSATDAPEAFAGAMVAGWRIAALHGDPAALTRALRPELSSVSAGIIGLSEAASMAAALAVATVRCDYPSQQDAGRARSALATSVAGVIEASGTLGADCFAWLASVTGEAALELSRTAASRDALVRVETLISLSSVRAAYELYGDANRAGELVARNNVATPVFMPTAFEALGE